MLEQILLSNGRGINVSLDIWLTATVETEVVSRNITHNLNKMWIEAGVYKALYESEGKKAEEVLPILSEGLIKMINRPEHFKQFNSPNGWGTYDNAVKWLSDLVVEFQKYPDGIIGVSR